MTKKNNQPCRIQLPAELQSLPRFIEKIIEYAGKSGMGEEKIRAMELALEEAIVNIVKYSSNSPDSIITVECSMKAESDFLINIIDDGPEFDPLLKNAPDITADISYRPIGGLGIFFIKKMTDGVSYVRKDGKNILTITMKK
jgi:serine/threonine-protein kinase RsbW